MKQWPNFLGFWTGIILLQLLLWGSCAEAPEETAPTAATPIAPLPPPKDMRYGIDFNLYEVTEKKIRRGDTFGAIMEAHGIDYPEVHTIVKTVGKAVDLKRLQRGKHYTLLYTKDSVPTPKYMIYQPDVSRYWVVHLRDSIYGTTVEKPITVKEQIASGTINNSLYETMMDAGLSDALTYYMSDIYAWSIDFFRLQKGDRFKVIYSEKFVDDSLSIGIDRIKAAVFEHKGKELYAFEFRSKKLLSGVEYFDQNAKNLRRAFLQSPVKFSRISSRYNLRRRIAYYGNRVRPHKGTDFAAAVGTPIMATANGTVVASGYTRGNGNYVKLKHNNIYATQYLHMKRRNVRKGDFVKQGDIIGWVGMTGYTAGPHVCYRFWKNGRQVDPFKQKLPEAKPISNDLKATFLTQIAPIKTALDCISYDNAAAPLNSYTANGISKN